MILTCPQCATRYQLKGSEFPASGRSVRCAKCRHIWFQNPPPPDAEADLVATSAPVHGKITASSSGADQQSSATAIGVKYRARGERTAIIACWLAFVAIVALIIW